MSRKLRLLPSLLFKWRICTLLSWTSVACLSMSTCCSTSRTLAFDRRIFYIAYSSALGATVVSYSWFSFWSSLRKSTVVDETCPWQLVSSSFRYFSNSLTWKREKFPLFRADIFNSLSFIHLVITALVYYKAEDGFLVECNIPCQLLRSAFNSFHRVWHIWKTWLVYRFMLLTY